MLCSKLSLLLRSMHSVTLPVLLVLRHNVLALCDAT